jgi:DNA-binding transcriptional MerR regulator
MWGKLLNVPAYWKVIWEEVAMRIGELAKRSGFSPKTLRYYDDIGLLTPEGRHPVSGFREYGEAALQTLSLIRTAKRAGLKLSEIRRILAAARRGSAVDEVVAIIEQKVESIGRHVRDLRKLRDELVRSLRHPRR